MWLPRFTSGSAAETWLARSMLSAMCFVSATALLASLQRLVLPEPAKPLPQGSQPPASWAGRPQSKPREGAPMEATHKRCHTGGCPSMRHFSAHREKSSVLQQGTCQSMTHTLIPPHSSGCSTSMELWIRPHRIRVEAKSWQEGWVWVTAPENQAEGKKAISSTP